MKNKILIIALIIMIPLAVWGIREIQRSDMPDSPLVELSLPIDIWPGNFWIIVADRMGYFEEEGIKAKLVDVSADYNQSVENFIAGNELVTQDMAVFDVVEANLKGADLVITFMADSSEGGEGMVARKEYKELTDLEGRRIGVEIGSYLDYFLEAAMLNAGISSDKYEKVDLVTETLPEVFEEENLDAAFIWEPDLSQMKEDLDLHIVFDTSHIRGLSPGVFPFRKTFIEQQPKTAQALVNTWHRATTYIMDNEAEVLDMIAGIDFADEPGSFYNKEEIRNLMQADPLLDLSDNRKQFGFDSGFESLYGNLQYVSRFIQRSKDLESMPDTNQMLTDQFLRQIDR